MKMRIGVYAIFNTRNEFIKGNLLTDTFSWLIFYDVGENLCRIVNIDSYGKYLMDWVFYFVAKKAFICYL